MARVQILRGVLVVGAPPVPVGPGGFADLDQAEADALIADGTARLMTGEEDRPVAIANAEAAAAPALDPGPIEPPAEGFVRVRIARGALVMGDPKARVIVPVGKVVDLPAEEAAALTADGTVVPLPDPAPGPALAAGQAPAGANPSGAPVGADTITGDSDQDPTEA